MMKIISVLIVSICFFFYSIGGARAADLPEDPPVTDKVFFEVTEDGQSIGKITIGLFGTVTPKTVKNFKELTLSTDPSFGYTGSIFHRIIPKFMIQGGDYETGKGYGGKSIYGGKFDDENFILKHDRPYRLSMANSGKNTNGSQFFLTTVVTSWLNGAHVVFGKVVDGFDVVDYMEKVKTSYGDKPVKELKISATGEVPLTGEEEEALLVKDEL